MNIFRTLHWYEIPLFLMLGLFALALLGLVSLFDFKRAVWSKING